MGEVMDPREELVDLIDEQDRVVGWARRERIRRLNLLHRGVGILCLDPDGRIYLYEWRGDVIRRKLYQFTILYSEMNRRFDLQGRP